MSVGMTPIALGHVENDWKCIAVNLGLLRVAVLIEEKKMHKNAWGLGRQGEMEPLISIVFSLIQVYRLLAYPWLVYFDSQVNSYVNHLTLSPQNHTKMVNV